MKSFQIRQFHILVFSSILVASFASSAHAETSAEKPKNAPVCQEVTKACEAAGFKSGDHKKTGKGLWMDCVKPLAHGQSVTGVSGITKESAAACGQYAKAQKSVRK